MSLTDSVNEAGNCPHCGASVRRGVSRCWLCERELHDGEEVVLMIDDENPYSSPSAIERESFRRFSLASMLLLVTLLCVLAGLFAQWPGAAMMLALFVFVPFMRTVFLVEARSALGKTTSLVDRLRLAAISATVMLFLVFVTGVAAVIALFIACWAMVFSSQLAGDRLAFPIFFGALILGGASVLICFGLFAARRWRRDVAAE